MELNKIIDERRSVNFFDPNGEISKQDLEKIIERATLSPSSYNLQHWHFLVVHDPDRKKVLKEVAYGQQKVEFLLYNYPFLLPGNSHGDIDDRMVHVLSLHSNKVQTIFETLPLTSIKVINPKKIKNDY
jgi:nitroreductase